MAASPKLPTLVPFLLRLYPRGWRARYADEFAQLLADAALTPAMVLDIVVSALDARWSGDYPAAAGDERKVRRPMIDRLAALLTAAGGIVFAGFILVILVASPAEGSSAEFVLLMSFPIAMAAVGIGIAGLSLSWLGRDPLGRLLGLVASAFAAGITLSILYLFFVGDAGFDALDVLFPGFAIATGLLGLRNVLLQQERRAGLVLLVAGAVGSVLWLSAALLPLPDVAQEDITSVNFVIATVAWGLVGMLRLRSARMATVAAQ